MIFKSVYSFLFTLLFFVYEQKINILKGGKKVANITQAEKDYLQQVLANIDSKIEKAESDNKYLIERMKETQHYMWESIYEMDNAEKAFAQSQMEIKKIAIFWKY